MIKEKETIETIINTAAIAMTATGTLWVTNGFVHKGKGFILIAAGMALEYFKYWGRRQKLW